MAFLSPELSAGELTLLLFRDRLCPDPADNSGALRLRADAGTTGGCIRHGQKSVNAKFR